MKSVIDSERGIDWPRTIGLVLLAGYLLIAHGCHPDEDTELCTRLWLAAQWILAYFC